jgi:hypothetical protein
LGVPPERCLVVEEIAKDAKDAKERRSQLPLFLGVLGALSVKSGWGKSSGGTPSHWE